MICLKHSQMYASDEFCPYCGNPYKMVTTTANTGFEVDKNPEKRNEEIGREIGKRIFNW